MNNLRRIIIIFFTFFLLLLRGGMAASGGSPPPLAETGIFRGERYESYYEGYEGHEGAEGDERAAYAAQLEYVFALLQGQNPAGFQAGFATAASRARHHAARPALGVLLPCGRLTPDTAVLSTAALGHPALAAGIGFVAAEKIADYLDSPDAVKKRVAAMVPVVEVFAYGDLRPRSLRLQAAIAANLYLAHFLAGNPVAVPAAVKPDAVTARLSRDGTIIAAGKGREVDGGQWAMALWVINTAVAAGWTIDPGDIIVTGSLAETDGLPPGSYEADFGPLGHLYMRVD